MDNHKLYTIILEKIKVRFSLGADGATQDDVNDNILKSIQMSGTNLWVLIFAIFIASLGLNTNSTAVIIGAMLISPLMGPIIGMGYAMGVYDMELLRSSLRNFLVMVGVSLFTSTLFFTLPIISFDQSELLARTQPTTYDILIAFIGGLAGMVAQTRKVRTGTVIPGVAIATALMPPLCTVGYGFATFQFRYMLGALYLFSINSIFIALAAYLVTKMMKYNNVGELDEAKKNRLKKLMLTVIIVITIPSVIIATSIMKRSTFESNSSHFIKEAFRFEQTVVVESNAKYVHGKKPSTIEIRLFGEPLSNDIIENLRSQMISVYHLKNTELIVRQAREDGKMDITAIQTSYSDIIREKNYQIMNLQQQLAGLQPADTVAVSSMARELGIFTDGIQNLSISRHISYGTDGISQDTTYLCILRLAENIDPMTFDQEKTNKIQQWLQARTGLNRIQMIIDTYSK